MRALAVIFLVAGCGGSEADKPDEADACGNGELEAGEACDDGNVLDGDGCDGNCTRTACGNGVVTAGEACDDGNAVDGDGCDRNCMMTACGNGVVTAGEACDDGNGVNGDGCDGNCTVSACGNGIVAGTEACDDGNGIDGDGCDHNCTVSACGNGIVAGTEACDDGNSIDTDDCRNNCKVAVCGDGVVATDATGSKREECDGAAPGGTAPVETAACNLDCTTRVCGDGKVNQTAGEECDDSNTSNTDACTNACRLAVCGDGILREAAPAEQCDDGNTETEFCEYGGPACTVCSAACELVPGELGYCGDGVAQLPFEACDDGNAVNGDWCDTNCRVTSLAGPVYAKASNTGAADWFGTTVALSADGSTLAVGAAFEDSAATGVGGDQASNLAADSGAVYVFVRSGNTWVQQGYLKASNTGAGDQFGFSVALSADGSTLAVGAVNEGSAATGVGGNQADNAASGAGAVYVFTRSGTAWSQQAYVKASNTDAFDHFGYSVALSADGSTLAVGATGEDSAATGVGGDQADNAAGNAGAVYVLARSGTAWSQQAYVKASNTDAFDQLGGSVALSADGSTLAVGAVNEDSAATGVGGSQVGNTAAESGAVYVFARGGAAWSQQAYVKASNTEAADAFGHAVALSGDGSILAVGAYGEDSKSTGVGGSQNNNAGGDTGAVYVFARGGAAWSQQAYVKASNSGANDRFGASLDLSADGSTLAVGALNESSAAHGIGGSQDDNSAFASGAAYRFTRVGTRWSQQAYLKASNTGGGDFFGYGVALSGDGAILAAGAVREDSAATGLGGDQASEAATDAGAVYVFQ